MSYSPEPETAEWLDWAIERTRGLPYKPTARWLFYRLVQEKGFRKSDYKKYLGVTSKARKGYYNSWAPDTLADDTRSILNEYGTGFSNPFKWFESQALKRPKLEIAWHQENLVIVCFEAKAMMGQFKHLLGEQRIPLCPFGGDASIPFKYQISELVDELDQFKIDEANDDDKPIYILYFGDYDPKGLEIPENAMRDIEDWSNLSFEYIRCGINREHISKYNIPDQPDAPGKYQWEALDENAAKEIVLSNVMKYWNFETTKKLRRAENACAEVWSKAVKDAILEAKDELGELELEFPETTNDEEEEDN